MVRCLQLIALMLWAMPCVAVAQDDTPALAGVVAPTDALEIDRSRQDFVTYPLITQRIAQRGGINGNISATRTVEGALTSRTYRFVAGQTVAAVADDYEQRLIEAGFDILYACEGEGCGPTFVRASPGYRSQTGLFGAPLSSQRYLAARHADSSGDVYAAIQVAPGEEGIVAQVDTLRVQPREIGAIAVNAEQMAKDLETKGRVALYGIFFDTDSAEFKPESRPTVGEIARLMKEKTDQRLLVVGHTDSRGSFDYNIELSSRRAQAVVDALVREHGIARDRLKPWGVGYSAPRASNDSDVGQAKNRRVELVIW